MNPSREDIAVSKTKASLLFALLLLFFFQMISVWFESIYRVSLVKLEMGKELCGILFLLVPLLLFFVRKQHERGFLWGAIATLLAARLLCPILGAPARIVVAGLGVAAFLIVFCYALSARYRGLQGDMGVAVGLAVLLSVALRSWRSSLDISMDGSTVVLGWLLVLLALLLLRDVVRDRDEGSPVRCASWWRRAVALVGIVANFAVVYLVVSSPAVVNAWRGGGRLGYVGAVEITVVSFAAVLLWLVAHPGSPSRGALFGGNVFFLALLVGGILRLTPKLPMVAGASAVCMRGDDGGSELMLFTALMWSPIIIFNVSHAVRFSGCARPRDAILPVLLGMVLLSLVTFLLIFTNVWGYAPYGHLFRNRFYLPFLVAGIGMLVPSFMHGEETPIVLFPCRFIGVSAVLIAALATAGVLWCGSSRCQPPIDAHRLTIMTYNMQQGSRTNGDRDYLGQLALLRRVNADIIGLQECDTARPSGGHVDTVRYFADALGFFSYYGPTTVSGTFGTALLSRYPIRDPRAFFTYSDSDEVGTAAAGIDVNGTSIVFFSNHPSGAAAVMNAHVDALIAEARKYQSAIAVGDFNFTSREPYFAKLAQVLEPSAAMLGEARIDNHGKQPDLANEIDHIFVSPSFRVLESHYLPPPDSRTDHPAHWSVIQMNPEP